MMEEDAHTVKSESLGPVKFTFDNFWVEGLSLPHFKLVHSIRRDEVASGNPSLFDIPFAGFMLGPSSVILVCAAKANKCH